MKVKQLSLQEVLNLEDGTKVWVEELKDTTMSALHIVDGNYLNDEEKDEAYCFDDIELYYKDDLEFYEWIEEEILLHKMSVEICNLRGLDLTDENIRLIIEEFKEDRIDEITTRRLFRINETN